jgi:nucleotide-binding universal stress UspA family protein
MKILICSEGSEQAERAIRLGAELAVACHAEVTLLGIMESPGGADALLDSLRRGQALLESKQIHAELITKTGEPIEEIVERTREAKYDLVVIGAVRKETQGLFWMSSKSYKIIKALEPPVLSVVGDCAAIKKVLVCSGGRRYSDAVVGLTGQIAHALGASVTLLHVVPQPPAIYAPLRQMEENTTRLLKSTSELGVNLRREKEMLEKLGVRTEVRIRRGLVLEQILGEIRAGIYDLVVTGSAPSRSVRAYVLGDISREIVNHAECPVLVARSRKR